MPIHDLRGPKNDRHGSKCRTAYRPDPPELTICKVQAATVPHGTDISRNGKTCWAAYHNGELVAVAETADAARRKYRAAIWQRADGTGQKCCQQGT